jgi:hypothetical protein
MIERHAFGTDLSVFRMAKKGPHNGVVFFAKPRVARRGYALATAAPHESHQQDPGQMHLFSDPDIRPQYPAHTQRTVSPRALAELYTGSMAGVPISFKNISLVPCAATEIVGPDWEKAKQEYVNVIADETFRKKTNARFQRIGSRARKSDL